MLTDEQRQAHLAAPLTAETDPGHGLAVADGDDLGGLLDGLTDREAHVVDHDLRPVTLGHGHDDDELTWTGPPIALPPGLVEHYAQRAQEGHVPGWFDPTTPAATEAASLARSLAIATDQPDPPPAGAAGEVDPGQWAGALATGTDVVAVGIADVLGSLLADVLASPDAAAVLVPREPAYLDNVIGVRLGIVGVELQWSDDRDHPGPYALLDMVEPQTGRRLLVVCNHRTASAQVIQLLALDAFPIEVIAQQGTRPLPDGQLPVWLTAAPAQPGY